MYSLCPPAHSGQQLVHMYVPLCCIAQGGVAGAVHSVKHMNSDMLFLFPNFKRLWRLRLPRRGVGIKPCLLFSCRFVMRKARIRHGTNNQLRTFIVVPRTRGRETTNQELLFVRDYKHLILVSRSFMIFEARRAVIDIINRCTYYAVHTYTPTPRYVSYTCIRMNEYYVGT